MGSVSFNIRKFPPQIIPVCTFVVNSKTIEGCSDPWASEVGLGVCNSFRFFINLTIKVFYYLKYND